MPTLNPCVPVLTTRPNGPPATVTARRYRGRVPVPVDTIRDAITDRLGPIPEGGVVVLLHLAQGHHLAWFDLPLFAAGGTGQVGERELNTVGYVCSRYGDLTPDELAALGDRLPADHDALRTHMLADPVHSGEGVTADRAAVADVLAKARSQR